MISVFKDHFFSETREELLEKIKKQKFFHDFDLGAYRTGSWVYSAEMPPNYHLFPAFAYLQQLDLKGCRAIDIGSYDGMTAFIMAELGVSRVDATCQFDLERFRLIRAFGRYNNVAYFPCTDLRHIEGNFEKNAYDLLCMTAMLHHLLSPLEALMIARNLLRYKGYLIVEAAIVSGSQPAMMLNTELDDAVVGAPTIWLPTMKSMEGMLKLAGFNIVSRYQLGGGAIARESNYQRVTYLAQAVKPSEIQGRSKKMEEIHKACQWNNIIDFIGLENDEKENANIDFSGGKGNHFLNIWFDHPKIPLQPLWVDPAPDRDTQFKIGSNNDFMQLMHDHQDDLWNKKDTTLLAAKYPGEIFPEGMTWSLKQFANLFCLSYIKRWGLKDVLEVGAGFNLYFENHLPEHCNYTIIDDEGFYEAAMLNVAAIHRKKGKTVFALLGEFSRHLEDESFDCCISVSVLEHVPQENILGVATDMYRVLKPGGWAIHSVDLSTISLKIVANRWLDALQKTGFLLSQDAIEIDLDSERYQDDEPFIEPLSIVSRFYGGFRDKPWENEGWHAGSKRVHTVLFAVRKPPTRK